VEHVQHAGMFEPGFQVKPAYRQCLEPAVSQRGELEHAGVAAGRTASRQTDDARQHPTPFEAIHEHRHWLAIIVKAQPSGEKNDLRQITHDSARPRQRGRGLASKV